MNSVDRLGQEFDEFRVLIPVVVRDVEDVKKLVREFLPEMSPQARLERLIQVFGLTAETPRRYQVVYWHHDDPDEPVILCSEIGVDGYETRKVEE